MTRNDEGVSRVEALDRHIYLVNETRAPINVQCSLLPILLAHTLTCTYIGSAKRSIGISTMNYHRYMSEFRQLISSTPIMRFAICHGGTSNIIIIDFTRFANKIVIDVSMY